MTKHLLIGLEVPSQVSYPPAFAAALRHMGVNFLNYYTGTLDSNRSTDAPAEEINETMRRLARECGCQYALSCHTRLPEPEIVEKNRLDPDYIGVIVDEAEHCRCLWPCGKELLIGNGEFIKTIEEAYEAALAGFRKLKNTLENGVSTHIWPVMHHLSARAGLTVCPKICKELYSPVSFAVGLGAALEYGVPLWADIDLWFYSMVPGHPPEELRQNLEFAYQMGADTMYLEGAGLNLIPAGHQGVPFSLFHLITDQLFELTPHGEVLRSFIREYIPTHPRDYTFRDICPEIAIIRFEDTCHGQRYADSTFGDRLYGLEQFKSSPETEEWLTVWDLITHGTTGTDGLTYFKARCQQEGKSSPGNLTEYYESYMANRVFSGQHTFFCPLNGAAVFDHLVGYETIQSCRLIFVTGLMISEDTWKAVCRRVAEGAFCVMSPAMAEKLEFPCPVEAEGAVAYGDCGGMFCVTGNIRSHALFSRIAEYLGSTDQIRYRLRDGREIIIRKE